MYMQQPGTSAKIAVALQLPFNYTIAEILALIPFRLSGGDIFVCSTGDQLKIDDWKSEGLMKASKSSFKSRLNTFWKKHPYKFDPWCYIPGPKPRDYKNAPTGAVLA